MRSYKRGDIKIDSRALTRTQPRQLDVRKRALTFKRLKNYCVLNREGLARLVSAIGEARKCTRFNDRVAALRGRRRKLDRCQSELERASGADDANDGRVARSRLLTRVIVHSHDSFGELIDLSRVIDR